MAAGFLYFLPNCDKSVAKADLLREAGLGYALHDDPDACANLRTGAGPEGQAGLIVAIGPTAESRAFNAQRQTWRKAAGGKFWIGLENDVRPGPEDLVRLRKIAGEPVKLADGNDWTIPVCFSIVRGSSLPKSLILGEDGESWSLETLPEFVKLCTDAATVWQAFADGATIVKLPARDAMRIAIDALSVNYKIGKYEVSLLRLVTTDAMWNILKAIADVFEVERVNIELQKKSSPVAG